jgi:hypothetical protein
LAGFYDDMVRIDRSFTYLAEIVNSVRGSEAADLIVGRTSMHDLFVAEAPATEPPFDVLIVRAPGSLREAPVGRVVIEHESLTGHDDKIERPVDDAVPLFWRFLLEKWDVKSARLSIRTGASRNALSCR